MQTRDMFTMTNEELKSLSISKSCPCCVSGGGRTLLDTGFAPYKTFLNIVDWAYSPTKNFPYYVMLNLFSCALALNESAHENTPFPCSALCSFALQLLTGVALYLFNGKIPNQVRDDKSIAGCTNLPSLTPLIYPTPEVLW